MAGQSSNTKSLIVFDFDETIIDGTSIFDIMHLYPRAYYADTQNIDMTHGWNEKNTAMFASLKSHGIDTAALKKVVLDIPLVNGMEELLGYLQSSEHDAILISGANTLFIDWYLEDRKLQGVFQGVYTNFANIKDGKLVLQCFHHQDNCKRCVRSICKGKLLIFFSQNKFLLCFKMLNQPLFFIGVLGINFYSVTCGV